MVYRSGAKGADNPRTQVAIYGAGRWGGVQELGFGPDFSCATASELFVLDQEADGTPAFWTLALDDGTVTSVALPERTLPAEAPEAQLACDGTGAVLVSPAADRSSNMTVQRLRDGTWVRGQIDGTPGSVAGEVVSTGAGMVVVTPDGRRTRARMISGEGGATTVIPFDSRSYVVPGLADDRVAFLGPFGSPSTGPVEPPQESTVGPGRLMIEAFE